ncbi:MAG: hypothetical protein Q8N49_01035 [Candidatus Omnitrophota bacterium]|nr:hypothetical protein [Candidatus Omnitrophota bacterium]
MKKIISFFLFFAFLPSFLMANTAQDDRRFEEEKRKSLMPTEIQPAPQKPDSPQPYEPTYLNYFNELVSKRVALRSDALQAVVVLLGVGDQLKESGAQVEFCKKNNIIPKEMAAGFDISQPLKKGLAAYMFCQAMEIKGGIWLRLLGMNQRYALKELAFEGIMTDGNVNDIVSGRELVIILTNAAEHLAQKTEDAYKK